MHILNPPKKIRTITLRLLSFIPTFLLLILIFGFSAQDGETSGSLSFKISRFLVQLFSPLLPAVKSEDILLQRTELIHLYVRKAAHMTEYFLLALSLQLPLAAWFSRLPFKKIRITIGFLCTVLFAALDEFHQTFVPGRSGNFTDICIDSLGALIASFCLYILFLLRQKKLAR